MLRRVRSVLACDVGEWEPPKWADSPDVNFETRGITCPMLSRCNVKMQFSSSNMSVKTVCDGQNQVSMSARIEHLEEAGLPASCAGILSYPKDDPTAQVAPFAKFAGRSISRA